MDRVWRGLPAAVALVALFLALAQPASASLDAEIQRKVQELERIEQKRSEVEQQLKATERNFRVGRQDLARAEAELSQARNDLVVIQSQLTNTEKQLQETESQLKAARGRLERRIFLLSARVRALHQEGRVSYLEVLLGSRNFTDFLTRFDMLRAIIVADVQLFREFRQERDEVQQRRDQVAARRDALLKFRQDMASKRSLIEQRASQQGRMVQQVAAEQRLLEQLLDQLDRDSASLTTVIGDLQRDAQRQAGQLTFIYPVRPVNITSPFGMRVSPITGTLRMHTGTDFAASFGQPVLAAEAGTVVLSQYYGAYGYAIVIDHGNGISTLYGHNSQLLKDVGAKVKRGDVVALAGSTGASTGPHVHLEFREYGEPVEPMKYLS